MMSAPAARYFAMNIHHHVGTCDVQHIVVALLLAFGIWQLITSKVSLAKSVALNHRSLSSVQYQYLLLYLFLNCLHQMCCGVVHLKPLYRSIHFSSVFLSLQSLSFVILLFASA